MKHIVKIRLFASTAALALATQAHAHVTLDEPHALAGAAYKAVLQVSHGCDGAATQTITVRIPPGFRGAKPMPKPGWTLTVRRAPLATPYDSHGKAITDDVAEITWQAATPEALLPDAHYDEFVLRGQAPMQPGPVWFKVLQRCETGQSDWAQVPVSGTDPKGLKAPALLLEVRPNVRPDARPDGLPPAHAGHMH